MLIDFLTMPLRAIDKFAAMRYARAVNYYLPFHMGFVGAACWFIGLLAASFEVLV